jgi:hypothetical protein
MPFPVRGGGLLAAAVLSAVLTGCDSDSADARPDIAAVSDADHFAKALKVSLYEFRAKVRKHGVTAAQQEVPALLEGLEGYEKRELGAHAATVKEIADKLKALEGSLGSANRDAAVKAADEIGALADKLPGTADPNPEVE